MLNGRFIGYEPVVRLCREVDAGEAKRADWR